MAKAPTEYPVGSTIKATVGPTRIDIEAEVTGHDGQFVLTKDKEGRERRVRPGSIHD